MVVALPLLVLVTSVNHNIFCVKKVQVLGGKSLHRIIDKKEIVHDILNKIPQLQLLQIQLFILKRIIYILHAIILMYLDSISLVSN
jgi:hypothetical protein